MNRYNRIFLLLLSFVCLTSLSFASKSESMDSDNSNKATESYNSGVAHMEKAHQILIVGDSAYAYNYRATSNAKAKREYEKAVNDFKDAIKEKPDMKEAYNNLGYCYRKLDKLDESLKYYKRALNLDSNFVQALEYMGETYLALGDLDNANKQLNRLKELQSTYADTLSQSIEIYKLNEINKSMKNEKK